MKALRQPFVVLALVASCGCGGGGTGDSGSGSSSGTTSTFQPSTGFANQCATPRTGTDPSTGRAFPDRTGTVLTENNWLRSWTNELYLWYREVPANNPASYTTAAAYFDVLKTAATTPSGNAKDKFHFTYPTAQWIALSQSGVEAGYGANWVLLASRPPRKVVVAFPDPGSPAAGANLVRGTEVLTVDGVDMVNANDSAGINVLNAGLFPDAPGGAHSFVVRDPGGASRTVTMVAANVTSTPVQRVGTIRARSGTVGYMLFNDHIATAEPLLVSAFGQLAAAGVSDLVLDIRYNGGGYLDIASEVAYMIAGPTATAGKAFEKTVFNDKNPTRDPVTGEALTPVPFEATTQGFAGPSGQALPTLNLPRVVVLTSANTCSASESIINGLRGIGVQVIQVGATTCGKPYGFYPADNCGTTYFSIQFQGVNAQGFGDYPDGFSPANTTPAAGVSIVGCSVSDDFTRDLGDPAEGRLAAALNYLADQTCPPAAAGTLGTSAREGASGEERMVKSPWRENRILRR